MLGNLFKESGVTDRLSKTATNELINIVTIASWSFSWSDCKYETFLKMETIKIVVLGVIAFGIGTAAGVIISENYEQAFKRRPYKSTYRICKGFLQYLWQQEYQIKSEENIIRQTSFSCMQWDQT